MVRLCTGTFLNVLMQCRSNTVEKTILADKIVKTIDPDSKYVDKDGRINDSAPRALNSIYKCTAKFSKRYSKILELAPGANREVVINRFESNVIPFIDSDKSHLAILALFDIIKNDTTLNVERNGENVIKFKKCIGERDIQDFLNPDQYDLAETLASIFLYTVTAVENTVGNEWLQKISSDMRGKKKTYESFFASYVASFAADRCSNKQGPERIEDVFYYGIEGFPVEDFIEDEALKSISSNLIMDISSFIGRVKNALNNEESPDRDDDICRDISEFINELHEYILFLMRNSTSPHMLQLDFELVDGEDEVFLNETRNCCQKLQALFYKIKDTVIANRNRLHEENVNAQRDLISNHTCFNNINDE